MSKRSFLLCLAFAALASLAFAAPSQAGSVTIVTTDITFSVGGGGTAGAVEVTYTPAVDPTAGLAITSTGGLTGLSISEAANTVTVSFDAAAATTGTLVFEFTTATPPPITFSSASLSGVTHGATGNLGIAVNSVDPTPEPTSVALLGIGIAGFMAIRRLFKRTTVA